MKFRILLVEDTESDIQVFTETVERMNDSRKEDYYSVEVAESLEKAHIKIEENVYHGSIIDIKLGRNEDGNDFIISLMENYRIPIIVYTGTPDVDTNVTCFKKGEKTPEDVIEELEAQDKTGVFKVMGGRGRIEKDITEVFWRVLYPQINVWKKYQEEGIKTEEILLRYTVAHMLEKLGDEGPNYCTEEMYIIDDKNGILKTGSILEKIETRTDYVLLSPPCDLAVHDGKIKTDTFLLCEVEPLKWEDINKDHAKRIVKNNLGDNYHWLPDNELYKGGRLNFRKLVTCSREEFESAYQNKNIKIQNAFVKSILQRFSTYYSRQGQPDFDFDNEAKKRKDAQ